MDVEDFITDLGNFENFSTVARSRDKIFYIPNSGSNRITSFPTYLAPEFIFLAGIISGDGHIKKDRYQIYVEMVNKEIILLIKEQIQKTFNIKIKVTQVIDKRPNRKLRWKIIISSRLIWTFFNKFFQIPAGKKSSTVEIPEIIFKGSLETKRQFITGLFLADGGIKRKKSFAFTCSNKALADQIEEILMEFNIRTWQSKWRSNISWNFIYDVMVERKEDIKRFKENFPLTKLKLQG